MQQPMQPPTQPLRQGLGDMKTQFSPTQQGYGNTDPMALYSLYGLLGTGQKTGEVPAGSTKPYIVPPAPTQPPTTPQTPAPSAGSRVVPGTPQQSTQPPASSGSRPVPNPPAPNPGNSPNYPLPNIDSYSGTAYDQQMAQYNSPEYAAYYNSLAPSTRAFMHAPGNAQTGQYLAQTWQNNYDAFNGNPWTRG